MHYTQNGQCAHSNNSKPSLILNYPGATYPELIQRTKLTHYLNNKSYTNYTIGKMSYETIANMNQNS